MHWLLPFWCFLVLLFSLNHLTVLFTAWLHEAVGTTMGTANTQQQEGQVEGRLDQ